MNKVTGDKVYFSFSAENESFLYAVEIITLCAILIGPFVM